MKILSSRGVSFKYHGDEILFYWPWARPGKSKYHSSLFSEDFNDFCEYWENVGSRNYVLGKRRQNSSETKITGFSFKEVVEVWSSRLFINEYIIVLDSPSLSYIKPLSLLTMPSSRLAELTKDIVVLRCKDKPEAYSVLDSIGSDFCNAYLILNGKTLATNVVGALSE